MHTELKEALTQADRVCRSIQPHQESAAQLRAQQQSLTVTGKKKAQYIAVGFLTAYAACAAGGILAAIPKVGPVLAMAASIAGTWLGVMTGVRFWRRDNQRLQEQRRQLELEAQKEEAAVQKILAENENILAVLPEEYRNADASGYLLQQILWGRSQTLNQALSSYDDRQHMRRMESVQERTLALQQNQADHLKSIRTSSKVNATANVANAIFNIASKL